MKLELSAIVLLLVTLSTARAQETGIRDNSFLIEEGYNQEHGVVQHILTNQAVWYAQTEVDPTSNFDFTQEWPMVGERVQWSYTLRLAVPFEAAAMHFRYQWMNERDHALSMAPRLSFLLAYETDRPLENMLGYQVNVPISKEFDRKRMGHANIGATFTPPLTGQVSLDNHESWTYHAGGSIIYALRMNVHVMTEFLSYIHSDRQPTYIINPGVRYAVNPSRDAQWVFGTGLPLQFGNRIESYGMFLYMSLEHDFLK